MGLITENSCCKRNDSCIDNLFTSIPHTPTTNMEFCLRPLKKGQWRSEKLSDSNFNEFKAQIAGQTVDGFTKHQPNGMMKVFEDTNGDGRLSKGDPIIAKGKVEKEFRCMTNPLDMFEVGKVKQTWESVKFDDSFVGQMLSPVLEFTNSDGDIVAQLDLQLNTRPWFPRMNIECPACFLT